MVYVCNCGSKYTKRMELKQHIGLLNPRWPRSDPSDEHWEIDKDMIVAQYRNDEIGYDTAIAKLRSMGYAEVRADNMLFERKAKGE